MRHLHYISETHRRSPLGLGNTERTFCSIWLCQRIRIHVCKGRLRHSSRALAMEPCYRACSGLRAQVVKDLLFVSSGTKGVGLLLGEKLTYQTDSPFQILHGRSSVLHQEEGWLALIGSGLPCTQFHDGQEQIPSLTDLRTHIPTPQS